MRILLLADIHGNYPALQAIDDHFTTTVFDAIVNCGDSLVYAPFANEVIDWLIGHRAVSILGNTDKKVLKLLRGKTVPKPGKAEKRVMYTHTAEQLDKRCIAYLQSLAISAELVIGPGKGQGGKMGIFHGSPARPHEFLFATTPTARFAELAEQFPYLVVAVGHSHTPFHFHLGGCHFINPGSVGRMFDGNPAASCAVLTVDRSKLTVEHHRIAYDIRAVTAELARQQLPPIYQTMFEQGKKLN
ncbi:MAG: metallophosphoesterase family protein [Desulfopila sp.]